MVGRWRTRRPAPGTLIAALLSLLVNFGVLHPMFNGGAEYGQVYAQRAPPRASSCAICHASARRTRGTRVRTRRPGADTREAPAWGHLLLPLAFLPLLAPGALAVALPILFEHLPSWRTTRTPLLPVHRTVTPVFVAAAVFGYGRVGAGGGARCWPWHSIVTAASDVRPVQDGVWQVLTPTEATRPTRWTARRRFRRGSARPVRGGVVAGFEF
jgi:hypothetical protein